MKKSGIIRAIAWVLVLACFLLFCTYAHASFASGDHDCNGIQCNLCLCSQLKVAAGVFLVAAAMVCLLDMPRFSMGRDPAAFCSLGTGENLVHLKVKLSD